MKYYLYIDECGDNNLRNFDEQFPIFTLCGIVVSEDKREWLEREIQALNNEPNMAYEVIKDNIYTENLKQVGIKIIPSI